MTDSSHDQSPMLGGQRRAETGQEPGLTGDRALLHLVEMLNAPDEESRINAVFVLAELGDERALEHLDRIIRDLDQSYDLRNRAAGSLIGFGRAAIPYFQALIDEADFPMWSTGVQHLGLMGKNHFPELAPEVSTLLAGTLEHRDDYVALSTLDYLGLLSYPDVIPEVIPVLVRVARDATRLERLRQKCIYTLRYFDHPEARNASIAFMLDRDISSRARYDAASNLILIGDKTCYPSLIELTHDPDPRLCGLAAHMLGVVIARSGTRESARKIFKRAMFDAENWHTATDLFAWQLWQAGIRDVTRESVEALISCLPDKTVLGTDFSPYAPDMTVQQSATEALEWMWVPMLQPRWYINYVPRDALEMNEELNQIFDSDRADHRQGHRYETPEYVAMRSRDAERRARVAEMREAGQIVTALDYFHAARIFQHGDTPDDAWTAHIMAMRAAGMGEEQARWLAAAAYDRWKMYQGKPQKYGTRYVSDGRRQRLWDVEPGTTDAERARWNVPPLAEQIRKAEEATRIDPPGPVGDDAPGWLKDAIARWRAEEGW